MEGLIQGCGGIGVWLDGVMSREKDLGMGGEVDGLVRDGMDKGIEGWFDERMCKEMTEEWLDS